MAVKIRLKRVGAKKQPYYRVVVADSRAPRDGKFIEEIGTYNPLSEPKEVNVDPARAQYWVGTGAKPTDTVARLFREHGIYDAKIEKEEDPEEVEEVAQEEETVVEEETENTEE